MSDTRAPQPPRQQLAAHEMVAQLRQLFRRTHMSVVNEAADLIESLVADVAAQPIVGALRAADAAPTTTAALRRDRDGRVVKEMVALLRIGTGRQRIAVMNGAADMIESLAAELDAVAADGGGGRGEGRHE